MDKRTINLVIGVILALLAIVMIHGYIKQQESRIARLVEEGRAVEVVVATTNIPKETTITNDMVTTKVVNRNALQPGDLTSLSTVVGQFAETDILKEQHINRGMIRSIGLAKYLSQAIPTGMRAITIPVNKISALEGLIKPGDKVDIIATFNIPVGEGQNEPVVVTLFRSIKVLATNRNISTYRVSSSVDTITLALEPKDIKILTYAINWGDMRLALRPPLDTDTEYGYQAVTFETLMKRLGMYQQRAPQAIQPTIDVYRGSQREEAPFQYKDNMGGQ